jgi:hypothetical protein
VEQARAHRRPLLSTHSPILPLCWFRRQTDFIVSGADDGVLKVWDRRKFSR